MHKFEYDVYCGGVQSGGPLMNEGELKPACPLCSYRKSNMRLIYIKMNG